MVEANSPNVVVFFTDQQRWDTVGAYGSPLGITPRLDAAAEEGTVVENAITTQPVCGPSRACLQTGQHATTHGVYTNAGRLPDGDHLLARRFDRAGYETGYVGKWHLAGTTTEPVPEGKRGGYRDYWRAADSMEHTTHPYEGIVYDEDGGRIEFDGYRVDELTEMALEFIREPHDAPFFLLLSHIEPHHQNDMGRYVAPEGYAYRHRNPWVPPDLRERPGDWYEELPDYYGICERLDECYGRLLDTLEAEGILEETIVLFLSDHGSHFRTRNAEYKRSCHESSVRIPMVFRGPGFGDGTQLSTPVSMIDVAPTLLDAAGLKTPNAMEGESVLPLIDGERQDARSNAARVEGQIDDRDREVLIQLSEAEVGRALRTSRWKYSVYTPDADSHETPRPDRYVERYLYDLAADPYERTNLAGRNDYREVADHLRHRLGERIKAIEGAAVEIEPAEFYP